MIKNNRLTALIFFVLALTLTACSVSGRSGKGCGCPGVHKKAVG